MLRHDGPIGQKLIHLDKVSSTHDYLQTLIDNANKPKEGTIVMASHQSHGKGLDKNRWESQAGMNLTFTVYLEPSFLPAEKQYYLNMSISLGLFDFVRSLLKEEKVKIKWPNDIYINDEKVAGILIRHAVSGKQIIHTIAGIGLNVNQRSFSTEIPNPVSIINYMNKESNLEECLKSLCVFLNKRYEVLQLNKLRILEADYINALYGLAEWRQYKYKNKIINARIKGIDEFGHLLLDSRDTGEISCDLKEIVFLFDTA